METIIAKVISPKPPNSDQIAVKYYGTPPRTGGGELEPRPAPEEQCSDPASDRRRTDREMC